MEVINNIEKYLARKYKSTLTVQKSQSTESAYFYPFSNICIRVSDHIPEDLGVANSTKINIVETFNNSYVLIFNKQVLPFSSWPKMRSYLSSILETFYIQTAKGKFTGGLDLSEANLTPKQVAGLKSLIVAYEGQNRAREKKKKKW